MAGDGKPLYRYIDHSNYKKLASLNLPPIHGLTIYRPHLPSPGVMTLRPLYFPTKVEISIAKTMLLFLTIMKMLETIAIIFILSQ